MAVDTDTLRSLPLFSDHSADELEELAPLFERREVSAGTRLISEGASGYSFFVIESGDVRIERDGKVLEMLRPGDFFGETAIVSGERRNATATADTDVVVLTLFGTDFRKLESDLPEAAEKIQRKIAERAERLSSR